MGRGRPPALVDVFDPDASTWMAAAACATSTAEFFPVGTAAADYQAAKAICQTCPVAAPCLEYAITHGIDHGMWGAHTPTERRRLRRAHPEEANDG